MKYCKYLPTIIGCAGVITYILSFFNISSPINLIASLGWLASGVIISLFFGIMGWNKDKFAGWLGLWVNLLPLGVLGFIYLNSTFNK
jgi:hypothetical protein